MNMIFEKKLTIPMELKEMYPLREGIASVLEKRMEEIKSIFEGKSNRFALIIGPCSADREDSVIDYLLRLREVQEKVKDKILIIPRIYTNKPRTTGEGYKGLLHQPDPSEKPDVFKGIIAMRELHMRAVSETGFASADELLYPENYKYVDDILGYVSVGARSVEDQQHRLTASGIEVPTGMKNPTGGDLSVMLNSVRAAQSGHSFIYRGWAVHSKGNPLAHAVLRGYTDINGRMHRNCNYDDLKKLCGLYAESGLVNPAVVVDANHANSGKDAFLQPEIIKDVLRSKRSDTDIGKLIKGVMVESYIEDGCQKIGDGVYGKSITDPCLGWEKTERLIYDMAEML